MLSQLGEVVHYYVPMVCSQQGTMLGKFGGELCRLVISHICNRSALAGSAQLQTKVIEMSERIRQLESALASSQSISPDEVHPLLKEELLSIKHVSENVDVSAVPQQSVEQIIDALGTMSIGKSGEGKYFGRSAGTEVSCVFLAESWTLL